MPQKGIKREERPWRLLTPEEWLKRYPDWKQFGPGSPKRQAYELIRRQARRGKRDGSWAERVRG
jgi:hypothetical protein